MGLQNDVNALKEYIKLLESQSGGSAGTDSYTDLLNKPQIEGITLEGNKTYEDLNLQAISNSEIEDLLT